MKTFILTTLVTLTVVGLFGTIANLVGLAQHPSQVQALAVLIVAIPTIVAGALSAYINYK